MGRAEELGEAGVTVMQDCEAVQLVEGKIRLRDEKARVVAAQTGEAVPEWVGED